MSNRFKRREIPRSRPPETHRHTLGFICATPSCDAEEIQKYLNSRHIGSVLCGSEPCADAMGYVVLADGAYFDQYDSTPDLQLEKDRFAFVAVHPSLRSRVPDCWLAKENVYLWEYADLTDLKVRCYLAALVLQQRKDITQVVFDIDDPAEMFYAALQFCEGMIVEPSEDVAGRLMFWSAECGYHKALQHFGDIMFDDNRQEDALEIYLRIDVSDGRQLGLAFCHKVLALMKQFGQPAETMAKWLQYAVDCGCLESMLKLRDCYLTGNGVAVDRQRALDLDDMYNCNKNPHYWRIIYEREKTRMNND